MATRRDFAKVVALAALSSGAPVSSPAQTPKAAGEAESPLADALTYVVRAQSRQYLDYDELKRVSSDFREYIPALEKFRAFKLSNSDEPDLTFSAVTKRWL